MNTTISPIDSPIGIGLPPVDSTTSAMLVPAVLWVFPAMLLGWSIHFLVNDDMQIGTPNLVFAVLTAFAILMARSELTD